jgi:putative MATE family efflux protein
LSELTAGSITKNLWKLAFPMILGNLLEVVFEVVDLIFVGRLGPEAIAAISLSGSILFVIFSGIVGVSVGTTAMVSRYIGADDKKGATMVANQSLMVGALISLALSVIGLLISEKALILIGAKGEVLNLAIVYLDTMFVGITTVVLFYLSMGIMQGAGDAKTPLKLLAVSNALNIILDPLLIFGIGPFPFLGVLGAALATVISRAFCLVAALYILASGLTYVDITPRNMRVEIGIVKKIIEIGIPSSASLLIRSVVGVVFISIVAMYGTVAIATYGIGMRIDSVVLTPIFGIASASSVLVGQNLGANKFDRAEKTAMKASHLCALMLGTFALVFFLGAPHIVEIFTTDDEVIEMGTWYLRIVVWSYIFSAYGLVLSISMNGAGDTVPPLVATVISLVVFQLPTAVILSTYMGTNGLWISIAISTTVYGIVSMIFFKSGRWKHKKVIVR